MKNGEQRGRIRSFVEAYLKKNGRLPFGGHNIDGSFIKFQTKNAGADEQANSDG